MSANRATPNVSDATPRADLARDLYGLLEYYLSHPDHPMPHNIDLQHYLPDAAAVDRWAAERGVIPFTGPNTHRRMASFTLTGTGPRVELTVLEAAR